MPCWSLNIKKYKTLTDSTQIYSVLCQFRKLFRLDGGDDFK